MRYFELIEFINALFIFALSGYLIGALYGSMAAVFDFPKSIYRTIYDIKFKVSKSVKKTTKNKDKIEAETIYKNIIDFIFILASALVFIILMYILLDGILRLFSLFSYYFFMYLGHSTLGDNLKKIVRRLLKILSYPIAYLSYIFIFPISKLCIFLSDFVIIPIKKWRSYRKSVLVFKEKVRELRYIFV